MIMAYLSFNIVEQAHAQLRRRNHGHHACKDGSKVRQFFVWPIVRANLSFRCSSVFVKNRHDSLASYL